MRLFVKRQLKFHEYITVKVETALRGGLAYVCWDRGAFAYAKMVKTAAPHLKKNRKISKFMYVFTIKGKK